MNGHARRAKQTLEALDFRYDEEASRHGKQTYWHPNSPGERVRIWGGMAEGASRAAIDKARQIAGLSSAGPRTTGTIREAARVRRANENARKAAEAERLERARRPYEASAMAAKAQRERAAQAAKQAAARREVLDLMRPGFGH